MSTNECNSFILCGDCNTSFDRNNAHTSYLDDFISRNQFRLTWNNPLAIQDFTYVNNALNHRSCIDHFIVSSNIYSSLTSSKVHYDVSNLSSHNVVSLICACGVSNITIRDNKNKLDERCAWFKADHEHINQYKCGLDVALGNIILPNDSIMCNNVNCKNTVHTADIDKFCRITIE